MLFSSSSSFSCFRQILAIFHSSLINQLYHFRFFSMKFILVLQLICILFSPLPPLNPLNVLLDLLSIAEFFTLLFSYKFPLPFFSFLFLPSSRLIIYLFTRVFSEYFPYLSLYRSSGFLFSLSLNRFHPHLFYLYLFSLTPTTKTMAYFFLPCSSSFSHDQYFISFHFPLQNEAFSSSIFLYSPIFAVLFTPVLLLLRNIST